MNGKLRLFLNAICLLGFSIGLHGKDAVAPMQTSEPWKPTSIPKANGDGFILIHGGTIPNGRLKPNAKGGDPLVRLEDFEMSDHTVTNAEYKKFVDATHFTPPLHWKNGSIARGQEDWPVIFVNRYDVDAYLAWRSKKEDRVYRLPSDAEIEYAARGGLINKTYPWGDEDPKGRANFAGPDELNLDLWQDHLKPVKSYPPNGYGLYDICGNVWQYVIEFKDRARVRSKYKIYQQTDIESHIAGGSWARNANFIKCEVPDTFISPGLRLPDMGFRLVREPAKGSVAFHEKVRRVIAVPQGTGKAFISWQLLPDDPFMTGFNIYRSTRRDSAGTRLNKESITNGTNFVDAGVVDGVLYYYRVRTVNEKGVEGFSSEWADLDASSKKSGLVASFHPLERKGTLSPVFGDLTGNGLLDCVIRFNNGSSEQSKDPGLPVEIEGYENSGRFLWRRPLVWHDHCYGSGNDVPVNVFDMDGDGKAEVICRLQEGNDVFLAILNGMTGEVLRKTPWPSMLTDFAKSSTRIAISIAYLDGKNPAIVTQTGLYENEVFVAYDRNLKKIWKFMSVGATSGSGSHRIDIVDVDGDGKDEVFDGSTCLNSDGTMRWSTYLAHADHCIVRDFLPDRPGLEVFYAIETQIHSGAYLVDANTGKIIWKHNRAEDRSWSHSHMGWAADVLASSPGIECFTNKDGHSAKVTVLFSADGKQLFQPFAPNTRGLAPTPVEWDGDDTRELMSRDGRHVGKLDEKGNVNWFEGVCPSELVDKVAGKSDENDAGGDDEKEDDGKAGAGKKKTPTNGNRMFVADLAGDFRDEVVMVGKDQSGVLGIYVYSPTDPISRRHVTRTGKRDYRIWLAHNLTGGYSCYYESPRPDK